MPLDPIPTYPGDYSLTESTNNPGGTETRREGDNQIRIMKANEKATWPNVTGEVTASHAELNRLDGVSLTNPIITLPSGFRTSANQDTAPPGWTIDAIPDEMVMRLTKGLAAGGVQGGTTGGTNNFVDQFQSHAEGAALGVGNHTLSEAEIPSHTHVDSGHIHNFRYNNNSVGGGDLTNNTYFASRVGTGTYFAGQGATDAANTVTIQSASANISSTGGGVAHGHTLDNAAKWAAFIVIVKD